MMPELETLQKLADASQKCFGLDLYEAYKTLPQEHIRGLVTEGLWYQGSATQGNLTEKGAKALADAREAANYAAVREALVEEARTFGYELTVSPYNSQPYSGRPEDEVFYLERPGHMGIVTLEGTAQLALFLVEERLCKAGKIR